MQRKAMLSIVLALLLLTGCAASESPQASEHEGYVDVVVVVPPAEENAEQPIASGEQEEAPVSEQVSKTEVENDNSSETSDDVKEESFTEGEPEEMPENVVDNKYAAETSVSFDVALENEFAPYLLPNQYVNYRPGSKTVRKAAELIGSETDTLKKVELVYDYVVDTLSYDTQKAATVQSGYLPVLDWIPCWRKRTASALIMPR